MNPPALARASEDSSRAAPRWGPLRTRVGPATWVEVRGNVAAFGATVAGVVLLGAPFGLIWASVAPHLLFVSVPHGGQLVHLESKGFIADDGIFGFLGLGFGVLAALGTWALGRRYLFGALPGLALGGFLASLVASDVGNRVGIGVVDHFLDSAISGQYFRDTVAVHATGVLVALPLAGLLTLLGLIAGFEF